MFWYVHSYGSMNTVDLFRRGHAVDSIYPDDRRRRIVFRECIVASYFVLLERLLFCPRDDLTLQRFGDYSSECKISDAKAFFHLQHTSSLPVTERALVPLPDT